MSSTRFKFMVRGKECLDGYVGASGGEVNEGGDDFGVSKSLLGEIPRVVIGESGGEKFRDECGAFHNWLEVIKLGMEVIDNDLGALTMFAKHFMGEYRKGVVRPHRRKMWWQWWERRLHGRKRWRLIYLAID
nr:hypothetical protein [Tanacetum cinerariifolium]